MSTQNELSKLELNELALQALSFIKKELEAIEPTLENCGLYNGLSGDLLFLYKLSCHGFSELVLERYGLSVDEALFEQKLTFIQQNLQHYLTNYGISRGLSGIGWFLEYVNQQQGEDYDEGFCHQVDKILLEYLSQQEWLGEIECVLGLGSIAAYAGRRIKMSSSTELFDRIVFHYEQMATELDDNTLTWAQPKGSVYQMNTDEGEPEFNLGLAHGVPGIISVLIPALSVPELHDRAKKLVVNACNWLLKQESIEQNRACFFAPLAGSSEVSRLGWCYGDLTIATTLQRVGTALGISTFIEKAKDIAKFSASRTVREAQLVDTGLCHGSAGLAIIFKQLHQQLEEPSCLAASDFWFSYTLNSFQQKGKAGFYRFSGLTKEYEENTSFLSGYAGIGLAVLTILNGEQEWNDSMFLS